MRQHFVVRSIRDREVARAQRSGIRHCEEALEPLDFGDSLLSVHPSQSNTRSAGSNARPQSFRCFVMRVIAERMGIELRTAFESKAELSLPRPSVAPKTMV